MKKTLIFIVAAVMTFAVTAAYAAITDFTLTDNGWTYREQNINKPGNQKAAGQPTNFFFGNVGNDVLEQNWWWFRAGGTSETALTNLTGFDFDPLVPNTVLLTYSEEASNGEPLEFKLKYVLTGIDPSTAKVVIDWTATNLSDTESTPLDVFSYTNTKLLPNPNEQNPSTVGAFSSASDTVIVTSNTSPATITLLAEATGSSPLVGWRLDDRINDNNNSLIADLTDGSITNFPTTSQSLSGVNAEVGFQWEKTSLAPGETTGGRLSKIIPEPSSALLAVPGFLSILALRRRRK